MPEPMPELSADAFLWMRVMYAYGILGADDVGIPMLAVPKLVAEDVFARTAAPNVATSILGSIWLSLGVSCVARTIHLARLQPHLSRATPLPL